MRKMYIVAAREYLAAVKTKAFIIGLLIMPIMMGGSVLVQLLVKDVKDTKEKRFAVIDRTPGGELAKRLKEKVDNHNKGVEDEATVKQVRPRFDLREEKPTGTDVEEIK